MHHKKVDVPKAAKSPARKILLIGNIDAKNRVMALYRPNSTSQAATGIDLFRHTGLGITCHVWNIGGQERLLNIKTAYTRGAEFIIICLDDMNDLGDWCRRLSSVEHAPKLVMLDPNSANILAHIAAVRALGLDYVLRPEVSTRDQFLAGVVDPTRRLSFEGLSQKQSVERYQPVSGISVLPHDMLVNVLQYDALTSQKVGIYDAVHAKQMGDSLVHEAAYTPDPALSVRLYVDAVRHGDANESMARLKTAQRLFILNENNSVTDETLARCKAVLEGTKHAASDYKILKAAFDQRKMQSDSKAVLAPVFKAAGPEWAPASAVMPAPVVAVTVVGVVSSMHKAKADVSAAKGATVPVVAAAVDADIIVTPPGGLRAQ